MVFFLLIFSPFFVSYQKQARAIDPYPPVEQVRADFRALLKRNNLISGPRFNPFKKILL